MKSMVTESPQESGTSKGCSGLGGREVELLLHKHSEQEGRYTSVRL